MEQQAGKYLKFAAIGAAFYLVYKNISKFTQRNIYTPSRTAHYFSRIRVNITGAKFRGHDLDFNLHIQNPNETPIAIKSIVGDIYAESNNGKTAVKLGNLDRYGVVEVKPNAETDYPFKVRLKVINTIAFTLLMAEGKINGIKLRFIGSINVNGNIYPLNEIYKIS